MGRARSDILNLPNALTSIRIVTIPIVLVYVARATPLDNFIAALVYSAAACTDFLDGYFARKHGTSSALGKFLDPLADKLFMMATLVVLLPLQRVPVWIAVVTLARELAVTSLRSIAAADGLVLAAGQSGKDKTVFQMLGLMCLILHYPYDIDFLVVSFRADFHLAGLWILALSIPPSLYSALTYLLAYLRLARRPRA